MHFNLAISPSRHQYNLSLPAYNSRKFNLKLISQTSSCNTAVVIVVHEINNVIRKGALLDELR